MSSNPNFDRGLDAQLREVPLPEGLLERLRRIAVQPQRAGRRRTGLTGPAQWLTAASLMIAIGLPYFGAMIAFLIATYPLSDENLPRLASSVSIELPGCAAEPKLQFVATTFSSAASAAEDDISVVAVMPIPSVKLELCQRRTYPRPSATAEINRLLGDEIFTAVSRNWGVLTAHTMYDDQPELEKVAGLIRRGVDMPLAPGSNKPFLIRYGVHPFVSPASHPRLCSTRVPLAIDTSSYELARRYLNDNELPPAETVRTEDFLSAIDYGFPRPQKWALGLSTAAGPSPFGGPGLRLLQVGVQARDFPDRVHPAVHLVLTVDTSASMRWGGRLEMVRMALRNMVRQLGPEDRISLVAFSQDARVLLEGVGPDMAEQLSAAVERLSVEHATNVGAGLRRAYEVARRESTLRPCATKVVLLTDGLAEMDRTATDLIEQRLAEAVDREIHLEVIDLRQEHDQDQELVGPLVDFARSGGGGVHPADSAEQIRSALLEIITGRCRLVAADARLKVTFNPKTVMAYRLLGHEAKAMAGLMPARTEADFHAGRSATALYEMQLKPGGDNLVATVELSWRLPEGSNTKRQMLVRKVLREQFATTFAQSPLSLQEAALVAQTAEVLRKSPFARALRGAHRLAGVLELAAVVDTRLYDRPTFVEFLSLVEQADGAKPCRSGGKR